MTQRTSEATLVARMVEQVGKVPTQAEVRALRPPTTAAGEQRLQKLLGTVAEVTGRPLARGDWRVGQQRTVVQLPEGGRAATFHASGALSLTTGLAPFDKLFDKPAKPEELTALATRLADALRLREWVAADEELKFERLWQIKAGGADRQGKLAPTVLCRAVGAFRHLVGGVPVLGAASAAVRVAAGGVLDAVSLQVRESTPDVLDKPAVLAPEAGVKLLLARLRDLMGKSKVPYADLAQPRWTTFGYLSLSRRSAQRLLAPVYVSLVDVANKEEAQGYLLVARATERTYLPLPTGREAPPARVPRAQLQRVRPGAGVPASAVPSLSAPGLNAPARRAQ